MLSTNTTSNWIPKILHQAHLLLEDLATLRPTSITEPHSMTSQPHIGTSWRTVLTASIAMAVVITASVRMLKPNSRNVHFLLLCQSPFLGRTPSKTGRYIPLYLSKRIPKLFEFWRESYLAYLRFHCQLPKNISRILSLFLGQQRPPTSRDQP